MRFYNSLSIVIMDLSFRPVACCATPKPSKRGNMEDCVKKKREKKKTWLKRDPDPVLEGRYIEFVGR